MARLKLSPFVSTKSCLQNILFQVQKNISVIFVQNIVLRLHCLILYVNIIFLLEFYNMKLRAYILPVVCG